MILCVGPTPSLDRTLTLDEINVGGVNRIESTVIQAGGKAVNVARVLHALGESATVAGALGGGTGDEVRRLADAEGLDCEWATSAAPTRICTTVVSPGGVVTDLNENGHVDGVGWTQFLDLVSAASETATLVLLSGSMPETPSSTAAADLLVAVSASAPVWIDSGDATLNRLVQECAAVELLKINHAEATATLGSRAVESESVESGIEAATKLSGRLGRPVIVTLGPNGAVYHDAHRCLVGSLEVDDVVNPTGSGDSFLAGFAAGVATMDRRDGLALALSCGASNARQTTAGRIDLGEVADFQARAQIVDC